ncbi:MAG: ATP-grasp domain-containing protein, partial [Burkholderiaceae bacterium]
MDIERIRALRGPNLWTRRTALEALVRCRPEETEVDRIPGFEAALRERFPQMDEWQIDGSAEPVPLARILQLATLDLQARAGCPVTFSLTTATIDAGVYQVVVEYTEEDVGRKALAFARELCEATLAGAAFDAAAAIAVLHELDEDIRLGPSTGAIVDAAVARRIPYRRLTQGSLVQFGWGSRARRIQAAEVDATSAIAESIAQDKELSKTILEAAGVPVPKGYSIGTIEEAWEAMQALGGRVVVKPRDGNQGRGVTVNIATREQLEQAYEAAREHGSRMIVERYIVGY